MTVSPPVSPSVVAAILMIQKAKVTSGTLLDDSGISLSHSTPQGTFICPIFLQRLNVQFAANVLKHPASNAELRQRHSRRFVNACREKLLRRAGKNSPNTFLFAAVSEVTVAGDVEKIF